MELLLPQAKDDQGVCFKPLGTHRISPMVSPLVHLAQTYENGPPDGLGLTKENHRVGTSIWSLSP